MHRRSSPPKARIDTLTATPEDGDVIFKATPQQVELAADRALNFARLSS